jgi:hypothetical protein
MIDLKALSLQYFYLFSSKNLNEISKMFAPDCQLRDWENAAVGKDDVVAVYEKIFNSVESIAVTPGAIYEDGDNIIAELLITINGAEQILVTDIITYNEDGKILSVRAYKG